MRRLGMVCVACGLAWIAGTTVVKAQDLRGMRLRVDPAVFTYSSVTLKPSEDTGSDLKIEQTTTQFGLFPNSMALGIGGSVSNTVNLGVSFSLAAASSTTSVVGSDEEVDADATTYALIPYVEAVLSPGRSTRPFIGAQLGVSATTVQGADGEEDTVATAFLIGADVGFHHFLNEHVSLHPQLHVRYASGSAEDIDISRVEIALLFGFSAWIGDSQGEPTPASVEAVPQQAVAYASNGGHVPPAQMARRDGSRVSGRFTTERGVVDLMTDAEHPNDVLIRLRRYHGMNVGPALHCGELAIVVGGTRHAIVDPQHSEEREGPSMRESLKGVIGLDVLRQLVPNAETLRRADTIDACGIQAPLTLEARANINSFLRSVERMHRDYHVDTQAAPATTAPAAAPTDAVPATTEPAPTTSPSTPATSTSVPTTSTAPATGAPASTPTTPSPATPATPSAASATPSATRP